VSTAAAIFLTVLQLQQGGPQNTTPAGPKPETSTASEPDPSASAPASANNRTTLNLLGQTDAKSGESRRNENVQFNLIDNNALKEINQRLGITATFVVEFAPERNYFGAEYGSAPSSSILAAAGATRPSAWRGALQWTHMNSATSARSFFQVGGVPPARENEANLQLTGPLWRGANLSVDGSVQRIRGIVNGNILVPLPSERTALAPDPTLRAYVQRILNAYPAALPNRPDIDPRMLNTNSPQQIDNQNVTTRLDQRLGAKDRLTASHTWIAQKVVAFQLLQGQNPDTTTRSHRAGLTWTREVSPRTVFTAGFRFDRTGSVLVPEKNNIGPQIFASNVLSQINPNNAIPIDRAQNQFRTAAQVRRVAGSHTFTAGFELMRRQMNGRESDAHTGAITFSNAFGNDAITNLRLGVPLVYFLGVGSLHRGFRNWDNWFYFADKWQVNSRLSIQWNVGYRPVSRPVEVNNLNQVPYYSDRNNFGPSLGLAYRLSRPLGVLRASYGMHFGEVFPVTFQQIRFNPPHNFKYVIQNPDMLNPLRSITGSPRSVLYDYEANLVSPYSQQFHFVWELEPRKGWRLQNGYVGSRAWKLLHHWYMNRAHPVPGVPLTTATVDQRRLLQQYTEVRRVTNGSRAYFDAFRSALLIPSAKSVNAEVAYWFSKSIDTGADYTGTAHDVDSFRYRSQGEYVVHADLRGRSRFDQPHAFLARVNYAIPGRRLGRWSVNSVALVKSGTPFSLSTGSDAPGFGNVDGMSGDRPNVVDPSILGRTIGHPDTSRQLLPRSAFAFIAPGESRGNIGRNVFRRGPIRNMNLGLTGQWRLPKERSLQFRVESNNFTNTPQFAEPGYTLTDNNFGVITNTLNDGRSFRFVLRLGF